MIKKREISCLELAQAHIGRIESTNGVLETFLTKTYDTARAKAKSLDDRLAAGEDIGPLGGIPFALKDNMCVDGVRTTCSSKLLENFIAPYSCHVYERLDADGAVLLGKVDMDEFAMGASNENSAYGTVKHPYDTTRVPGGSSGASAASVASGQAAFALGSDTGGSIRTPAAFCNLTGFKPTYGTVSRYGLVAFASSFDQIGPLTKDIRDAALIMDSIAGHDPRDSTSIGMKKLDYTSYLQTGIKGIKIGVDRDALKTGVDDETKRVYAETIETLKKLGAIIVEVSFDLLQYTVPVYYMVACSEASSNLARFDGIRYGVREPGKTPEEIMIKSRSAGFGKEVKRRIMLGTYALSAGYYDSYYNKALKVRRMIKNDFYQVLDQCDAYLCPTTPAPAFKIGEKNQDFMAMYAADIFTVTANLTGIPSVSFAAGKTKEGLPIGMQLMTKALNESGIFRAVYNFQLETDWHKRRPEL
jgi:aspartyl-tRNA(Asn)/glutamyl-tRNA(Gln) amidotransferase subunit A